jgi:hypothetical protein
MTPLSLEPTALDMPPSSFLENDGQPPSAAHRDPIWRCGRLMTADASDGDQALCPPAMDGWSHSVRRGGTLIRCACGEPAANAEHHYVEPLCHTAAGLETTKEADANFSATSPEATLAMSAFDALGCGSPDCGMDASAAAVAADRALGPAAQHPVSPSFANGRSCWDAAAALILDPTLSTSPPNGLEAVIPFETPRRQADDGSAPSYERWVEDCVAYDDLLYGHPSQGDPACPLLNVDDIDFLFDEMASAPLTSLSMHVNNRGKEPATRPSPATLVCDERSSPARSHGPDSDTDSDDSDLPTLEEIIARISYRKRLRESGTSPSKPVNLTTE